MTMSSKSKIYLRGYLSSNGLNVQCSASTSIVLFMLHYTRSENFEIVCISDAFEQNNHDDDDDDYKQSHIKTQRSGEKLQEMLRSDKEVFNICKDALSSFHVTFVPLREVPTVVQNVCLPSLHQPDLNLVRSGLCVILRHIINAEHKEAPSKHLHELLGFKEGSMKMCSEVSSWTKLCEVELPNSITKFAEISQQLKHSPSDDTTVYSVPLDLIKLEKYFQKDCKIHNVNKRQRADLATLQSSFSDNIMSGSISQTNTNIAQDKKEALKHNPPEDLLGNVGLDRVEFDNGCLRFETTISCAHGVRKFNVNKVTSGCHVSGESERMNDTETEKTKLNSSPISLQNSGAKTETTVDTTFPADVETSNISLRQPSDLKNGNSSNHDEAKPDEWNVAELSKAIKLLTSSDVQYVHLYSEGLEMTLADVILFVCFYHLVEALEFNCYNLPEQLPLVFKWASHMISLSAVSEIFKKMGWNLASIEKALSGVTVDEEGIGNSHCCIVFKADLDAKDFEVDVELCRYDRIKYKALPPEVYQALEKLEKLDMTQIIGCHPCGESVQIAWDSVPSALHPKEGDVPKKRTERKCQQIENLVTAVQAIARTGDVVVDFCSGGGHVGIVCAYFLPHCQVFLVENKEESLLKCCSRIESLGLKNVTLYQCNIDYFIGNFNVGLCLHACGTATDMVMQLCLNSQASFVICPCCYGSIQNTHLLSYPRSGELQKHNVSYTDFLAVAHAADQTEFSIALQEQGKRCMNLVDFDRAIYAKSSGYSVTLCSLQPHNCTPKNNLLIGRK